MARVNPTNPLESIDIRSRTLDRTKIAKVKQTLFNIGEDYEDPKVQFKYYRIMAARYGNGFVIARRQSGNLWSWGCSAAGGQLGTGSTEPTEIPTLIDTGELDFSRVFATGRAHTLALDVSGAPYTWGNNTYGQLGDGNYYPWLFDGNASGTGQILERATGMIFTWGSGILGSHGSGFGFGIVNRTPPSSVLSNLFWVNMGLGSNHGLAITVNGDVYAWGNNSYGQLGTGNLTAYDSPVQILALPGGIKAMYPGTTYMCNDCNKHGLICGGDEFSLLIGEDRQVYGMGRNSNVRGGALGDGTYVDKSSPVSVWYGMQIGEIACGESSSYGIEWEPLPENPVLPSWPRPRGALQPAAFVWATGQNSFGQLGDGTTTSINSPVEVIKEVGGQQLAANKISAGNTHACAAAIDNNGGQLFCWGRNTYGQLGDNTIANKSAAVSVAGGVYWKDFSCGQDHTCALRASDGTAWCWGRGTSGQLGTGAFNVSSSSPVSVLGGMSFVSIGASDNATCGLLEDGSVYCWGSGYLSGLNTSVNSPVQLPSVSPPSARPTNFYLGPGVDRDYVKIVKGNTDGGLLGIYGNAAAAGWGHSLMIDQTDSKAWAWGLNNYGQLGVGDTTDRYSPEEIALGAGRRFRKIDAGDEHTITLDQRGKVWTWGSNAYGQLGDGTNDDSAYPTLPQEVAQPDVSYTWRDGIVSDSLDPAGIVFNRTGVYPCQWQTGGFEFSEGDPNNPVPWIEPLVLSVEFFEFNLSSGETNEYQSPSKGQILDNCVPFMSGIQHVTATGSTNFNRDFCRILLEGGSVRCSRGTTTGSQLKIGVFLVEFNSNRVRVQKGRIDAGGQSATITIDPVSMSKAFIYHSWRCEGTNNVWRDAMVRAKITSPTSILIDRYDGSGDMDVGWWVVESLDDYGFIVQTREWQHVDGSGVYSSSAITKGNADKMLNLISWKINSNDNSPNNTLQAWFEPAFYNFQSSAGNTVTGRVADMVGQAITFLDGTKSVNKWYDQDTKKLDWTTNLTDWDQNVYPGGSAGYESFFGVNGDFSAIIAPNPQGLSVNRLGFLDSLQVYMEWGTGDPPGYGGYNMNPYCWVQGSRGNNAYDGFHHGLTIYDVIEFDNLDEQSTGWRYRPNTPKAKTRTFGSLDGATGFDFNTGAPLADVWVQAHYGNWGTGNFDFSYKVVFRTPIAGAGVGSGQVLFWYGSQTNWREQIRAYYVKSTRELYAGHEGENQLVATLDPETWYTLHVTYNSTTQIEKYFLNGTFVTQRVLAAPLTIVPVTTFSIMNHGWIGDAQFHGRIDEIHLWKEDISDGQLLIGGGSPRTLETRFIEVAAGAQSSYGIDINGKLWTWGDNTYGQLGDGTTVDKSIPVSVSGRHSFIQVTAGGRISEGHACGLKADGSVWCWGRNNYGQLGVCDYSDRSTPTSVIGRHSFIDVWAAKDGYNTIAIKLDGSVWVWGKTPFCAGTNYCSPVSIPDFNLITLNILGRGYLEDHSLYLEY